MKTSLTKNQIVCERMDACMKTLGAALKFQSSNSFEELQEITKLDKTRLHQATVSLWSVGGLNWVDPKTKKTKSAKKVKEVSDYCREIKKWASAKDEFENDAEYLFATIDLLPASTFKELRVLTGLDEHNLCVAIMWLCENDRIFIEEIKAGDCDNEDEMYYPAGIFDKK